LDDHRLMGSLRIPAGFSTAEHVARARNRLQRKSQGRAHVFAAIGTFRCTKLVASLCREGRPPFLLELAQIACGFCQQPVAKGHDFWQY